MVNNNKIPKLNLGQKNTRLNLYKSKSNEFLNFENKESDDEVRRIE